MCSVQMRVVLSRVATVVYAIRRVVQPGVEAIVANSIAVRRVGEVKHGLDIVLLQLRNRAARAHINTTSKNIIGREGETYSGVTVIPFDSIWP